MAANAREPPFRPISSSRTWQRFTRTAERDFRRSTRLSSLRPPARSLPPIRRAWQTTKRRTDITTSWPVSSSTSQLGDVPTFSPLPRFPGSFPRDHHCPPPFHAWAILCSLPLSARSAPFVASGPRASWCWEEGGSSNKSLWHSFVQSTISGGSTTLVLHRRSQSRAAQSFAGPKEGRLRQRQLHRRLSARQGIHRHARAAAVHVRLLLANGLGAACARGRHDHQLGRARQGKPGSDLTGSVCKEATRLHNRCLVFGRFLKLFSFAEALQRSFSRVATVVSFLSEKEGEGREAVSWWVSPSGQRDPIPSAKVVAAHFLRGLFFHSIQPLSSLSLHISATARTQTVVDGEEEDAAETSKKSSSPEVSTTTREEGLAENVSSFQRPTVVEVVNIPHLRRRD